MTSDVEYLSAVEKGYMALMQSETEQALDFCQEAAKIEPQGLLHVFVLGLVSMSLRDIGRAIKFMEEGHRRAPNVKEFADSLAALHARVGNMSESMYFAKLVMVMESDPEVAKFMPEEFSDLERNLEYAGVTTYMVDASIAFHERDYRKAIDLCSRELAVHADSAECHRLQGRACIELHEYDTGIAALRRAVELDPGEPDGHIYLGDALLAAGEPEEATSVFREGISSAPDSIDLRNRLVRSLAFGPDDIWKNHGRDVADISNQLMEARITEPARPVFPDSSDKLTIGFLINESARATSLRFADCIFKNYDKSRLKIVVYQQYSQPYQGTTGLVRLVDDWRQTFDIDDTTLDMIIRNDGIQVLIDLCGLQPGHRQQVLAGAPAPVRVNWLGFPYVRLPATTDVMITDDVVAGSNETSVDGKEAVSLGECQLVFGGGTMDLETGLEDVAPSQVNGFVTFGAALDPVAIKHSAALWSSVLQNPETRLHFGGRGLVHPETKAFIATQFDESLLARISIGDASGGASSLAEFLASIDVLLDPIHVSDLTLICDALWMGVPVVTLLGDRPSARIGGSILRAAGRPEWVADDLDGYTAICTGLAQDSNSVAATRRTLREQISESPLCDQPAFTRRFEEMISAIGADASAVR